ncbi:undecaprenyl-diphosphatase [Amycolatopsis xylanica]|uniref:Undecaprenyl-diphosphatase n=1 Tax=Amycolatopsis xylanica TaxID=589385 RepID=A0A1H3SAM9_9PSEU|nr:phosphatase PAP2 family protein [Amycolatopsis xylanica]SDZ35052.1 undecaprenyl-diphosphatase [Amycolatopsis xylanica]
MAGLVLMLFAVVAVAVLARRGTIAVPVAFGTATVFALGAAVAELTDNVIDHDGLTRGDLGELQWFIAHRSGWVTSLAVGISDAGDTLPMAALAGVVCAWAAWRRRWDQVVLVAVATAGAGALVLALKMLVGRSRPPVIDRLVPETNQSFPSGHSLSSAVVLGVLATLVVLHTHRRAVRIFAVTAAVSAVALVGLSRLYLGVHWPSDVLGGWTIGMLWLATCVTVYMGFRRRSATGHAVLASSGSATDT